MKSPTKNLSLQIRLKFRELKKAIEKFKAAPSCSIFCDLHRNVEDLLNTLEEKIIKLCAKAQREKDSEIFREASFHNDHLERLREDFYDISKEYMLGVAEKIDRDERNENYIFWGSVVFLIAVLILSIILF